MNLCCTVQLENSQLQDCFSVVKILIWDQKLYWLNGMMNRIQLNSPQYFS